MLRKPPGPVLIPLVTALCAMELFMSGNLGGDLRMGLVLMMLASVILFLGCLAQIELVPPHLKKTWTSVLRLAACPVLLLATGLLVAGDVPMKVRFELSRSSLDSYARSLQGLPLGQPCDSAKFERRRVGLFTVTCAERHVPGTLTLQLGGDPLTPTGTWHLTWSEAPDPDTQEPLNSHWSLVLED